MLYIIPINNCFMNSMTYVIHSDESNYCILIDCGEYKMLSTVLTDLKKEVKAVLLTHGHSDHIWGLQELIKVFPDVIVYTTKEGHEELKDSRKNLSLYQEMPFTIDDYNSFVIKDGLILHFDCLADVKVIATPGHDPSCISYIIGPNLFTGDSYIPGVRVFSKFPRGNKELALKSRKQLEELEAEGFRVYCGHHDY